MAAEGAAFAVLVGLDGSAAWRAARVLMVVLVTAGAVWFTRRAGRAGRGATALALGIAGTVAGAGAAARTWPRRAWTRPRSAAAWCW